MYYISDYIEVVRDYRYKRTNNALNITLEFDYCRVYLGHTGVGKNDLALTVTDPKLFPSNSKDWIRVDPKELQSWLEVARESDNY